MCQCFTLEHTAADVCDIKKSLKKEKNTQIPFITGRSILDLKTFLSDKENKQAFLKDVLWGN